MCGLIMDYDSYVPDLHSDSDDDGEEYSSRRNNVPLKTCQEDELFKSAGSDEQFPDTDPKDPEEFSQVYLAKLKSLREQLNWENEEERYPFYLRLLNLMQSWRRGNFPNLKDVFRREEIDWLLMEAAVNRRKTVSNERGKFFISFVVCTGYKDEPELNEDGKPSFHRTTALHRTKDVVDVGLILQMVHDLFVIYNRFDVNYTDESGYTHFHVACKCCFDHIVKKFLELGQDPNCLVPETGDSPLHLALYQSSGLTEKTIKLLLSSGADPNVANKEGLRPLHIICKRFELFNGVAKSFFEINDEKRQTVQIEAKDSLGRTPLQLAVASLLPDVVDVLLDHGADLSSFVFPAENYFGEIRERDKYDMPQNSYLNLVYSAVAVVERLEKRGYELDRRDALTIMKYFDKFEFFKKPVDLVECLREKEKFVKLAKKLMFNSNLSLYKLIQLPPEEVEKVVTYRELHEFHRSSDFLFHDSIKWSQACKTHLSEMMARRFLRRWALEPLVELTRHYQLPILCCDIIIKQLKNQDLMNVCFAVMDKGEA